MRIFTGVKERGLKRILSKGRITDEILVLEGRLHDMESDGRIKRVLSSTGEIPAITIYLNRNFDRKEILEIPMDYGFKRVKYVSGNEDMECENHNLHSVLSADGFYLNFVQPPYKR